MKRTLGFLIFVLAMISSGCSSDHDHFRGYEYEDYASHYYYYDGYYYSDPEHHYRYDFDYNHYYYGRLEWKGDYWAVVLRENPYYGMICAIYNDGILPAQLGYHNVYDHDVMVRFRFIEPRDARGLHWVDIEHIYYR
ncbi:MAG: hypothetical protein J6Y11_07960 [Paludibacteraceae bacterium]|nr:hypothetical protein [Paludibacteraceae bacterium]